MEKSLGGDVEGDVFCCFVYVVFLFFFGVVVDCDVVGPRKFGDFGSRGESRLRGNVDARLTTRDQDLNNSCIICQGINYTFNTSYDILITDARRYILIRCRPPPSNAEVSGLNAPSVRVWLQLIGQNYTAKSREIKRKHETRWGGNKTH
jgi:hypothetical protein